MHLACDAFGRPLAFVVTGGSTNDCTQFTAVMHAIRVPRIGPGRPRIRPAHVLGDKGYSSKAIRTWLRRRGIGRTMRARGRHGDLHAARPRRSYPRSVLVPGRGARGRPSRTSGSCCGSGRTATPP
ncbi:transposase [Streptomyces herbicida]|uniref:transposase n=1 Tax=Streptomyces herbicida TaxID=3065675 RepID=UPI0038CD13F3